MRLFLRVLPLALVLTMLAGIPAFAQEMPPLPGELVIGDLGSPRGIAFDAEGNLIVAVAGTGGDQQIVAPGPDGQTEFAVGLSGQVISVSADGESSTVLQALPSYAGAMETTGIYRAIPNGDALWLLYSTSGPYSPFGSSIVELDMTTGFPRNIISLGQFEALNNPDGNEIDSNVSDIAWTDDGTVLITDAGANALLAWTEEDGLSVVANWPENSVPTSVEVAENGDVYVGFLGAGIAPGAAKIEHWSDGEVVETFEGLTGVTDILLDGDTLYAVQLFLFGEQGPGPGSVVMVSADGITPVAEGLLAPFALAQDDEGALYVSFGTIALMPGMSGGVVKLSE